MKVGIYSNKTKDFELLQTGELAKKLRECGITPILIDKLEKIDGLGYLAVLGGDGTILRVAAACAKSGVPILGINLGSLGFLTEFERGEIDEAISILESGEFNLDSRALLKVNYKDKEYFALNDAVVQRVFTKDCESQVIRLSAYIDGEFADSFTCDGLIVSTPTGSTAYSLSCGGGIMTPELSAFSLTPICAHSLRSRPIIFSDRLSAKIIPELDLPTMLVCDGAAVCHIDSEVSIEKAPFTVSFIRRKNHSFFKRLIKKLNKWSTE